MSTAYICEGVRTPIGRYAGALAQLRTDDLAAHPLAALRQQFSNSDWESVDEIYYGCVNQAGEDNRNVARMAALLAGIPHTVPAVLHNDAWLKHRVPRGDSPISLPTAWDTHAIAEVAQLG